MFRAGCGKVGGKQEAAVIIFPLPIQRHWQPVLDIGGVQPSGSCLAGVIRIDDKECKKRQKRYDRQDPYMERSQFPASQTVD